MIVIAIETNEANEITNGREYEVIEDQREYEGGYIINSDSGKKILVYAKRFKIKEETMNNNKLPKYWVVENNKQVGFIKVLNYLNEIYENHYWSRGNFNYYGYDGNKNHGGTNAWDSIDGFENNPTLLTLEQFNNLTKENNKNMKKIVVGYRLLKELPGAPKGTILKWEDNNWIYRYGDLHFQMWSQTEVETHTDWFEPVYEEEKIEIGGVKLEFMGSKVYIREETYSKGEILQLTQILKEHQKQIKSINVGCSGQYKVDLELVTKILNKL